MIEKSDQGRVIDPIQEDLRGFNSTLERWDIRQTDELVNRIGSAIQTTIELPRQGTDPLAYRLTRVVREDAGQEDVSTLTYFLRPPEAIQQQLDIDMIRIERGMYEERGQVGS